MCKSIEDMRKDTLKECMLEVARRMLADEVLKLDKIAEYTGLSVEEVEKFKKAL